MLGFEIAYGAAPGDAVLYLAYEAGFVVIPGWLAYRALTRQAGDRYGSSPWAGPSATCSRSSRSCSPPRSPRGLFLAYPLVVGLPALAVMRSRRPPAVPLDSALPPPRSFAWLLAAVCIAAVTYISLAYFPTAPLPGQESVNYFPDYPRWIAIAADAKHHWPIEDPSVAGEPLPYHYFVYVHMAAASQVTGLDLPLVFLRLFILPLAVLLVLELVVAGRSFAQRLCGLIAACLAFFIGELRLDPGQTFLAQTPFGLSFIYLFRSPSFLLGMVVFVPLIILLGERLTARGSSRVGDWLLVIIFMVGASDAKITILPLVLGALVLYAGSRWILERRVGVAVLVAIGLTLVISGAVYLLQYQGHSSGLGLNAFATFDDMPAVTSIEAGLRTILPVFRARKRSCRPGILFGLVGLLLAPLVGLAWIFRRHGLRLGPARAWLLCACRRAARGGAPGPARRQQPAVLPLLRPRGGLHPLRRRAS